MDIENLGCPLAIPIRSEDSPDQILTLHFLDSFVHRHFLREFEDFQQILRFDEGCPCVLN